jgi:hypothetical protein
MVIEELLHAALALLERLYHQGTWTQPSHLHLNLFEMIPSIAELN